MESVNKQLNFSKGAMLGSPRPQLVPILPTNSASMTLSPTSSTDRQIVVPNSVVMNWARSYVSCLVSFQAAAAQLFAFGDNCLGLFRSCEIVDVKNYVIAQILNASHYYAVMNRAETSYIDFMANGIARDGTGSTVSLGSYNGIQKRWSLATTTITYSTYLRPSADATASPPPTIYALDVPV